MFSKTRGERTLSNGSGEPGTCRGSIRFKGGLKKLSDDLQQIGRLTLLVVLKCFARREERGGSKMVLENQAHVEDR